MKTYMHDERHRIEEGWAMGRPPRPIEPDYDGDGEPIFDDGKLGDGMDFGRIYEPHTFADSPEECRQLSEEMAEEVQTREEMTREEMAQRIERLERALYFVAEKVEGASTVAKRHFEWSDTDVHDLRARVEAERVQKYCTDR